MLWYSLFVGDEELDDAAELTACRLHEEAKTIRVEQRPRYRHIGVPAMKIKVLRFNHGSSGDYKIVKVSAKLPPFHIVLKRIVRAALYLLYLDR